MNGFAAAAALPPRSARGRTAVGTRYFAERRRDVHKEVQLASRSCSVFCDCHWLPADPSGRRSGNRVAGRDQGDVRYRCSLLLNKSLRRAVYADLETGRNRDAGAETKQDAHPRQVAPLEGRLLLDMERRQRKLLHHSAEWRQIFRSRQPRQTRRSLEQVERRFVRRHARRIQPSGCRLRESTNAPARLPPRRRQHSAR